MTDRLAEPRLLPFPFPVSRPLVSSDQGNEEEQIPSTEVLRICTTTYSTTTPDSSLQGRRPRQDSGEGSRLGGSRSTFVHRLVHRGRKPTAQCNAAVQVPDPGHAAQTTGRYWRAGMPRGRVGIIIFIPGQNSLTEDDPPKRSTLELEWTVYRAGTINPAGEGRMEKGKVKERKGEGEGEGESERRLFHSCQRFGMGRGHWMG
jgi:hypothetical protein